MTQTWTAVCLTLFPDMFPGPLGTSLTGAALTKGLWQLSLLNFRDFATDKHRSVDDTPAGGGPGMVMRPDVVARAVDAGLDILPAARRIYLSPRGRPLTQALAHELDEGPGVLLVCGRFEGLDERVIESRQLEEISIGDFIMTGGELAAMALIDAAVRLQPGVVGSSESLEEESFEGGLLEHPHYTRPRTFEGRVIPEVLLEGNHEKVRAWRLREQQRITRERRPDLWQSYKTQKS